MDHIILVRMNNDQIVAIMDDEGDYLAVFESENDAHACAYNSMICKTFGYQIVELEI